MRVILLVIILCVFLILIAIRNYNMDHYTEEQKIIAGGGYGIIVKNDDSTVTKYFKTNNVCTQANKEYNIQQQVYQNPLLQATQIHTPRPIKYTLSTSIIHGERYLCSYQMEYLRGVQINDYNVLVHAAFSKPFVDTISFVSKDSLIPRGWFSGERSIQSRTGVSPETIAQKMGFSLIILVLQLRLYPFDVEYIVDDDQRFHILDFGMTEPIEGNIDIDKLFNHEPGGIALDLYYPSADSSESVKSAFVNGIKEAMLQCNDDPSGYDILNRIVQEF